MSYWCRWCWWPLLAKLHVSKVMFPMTSTLRSPNWFTVFDSFVRLQSSKKDVSKNALHQRLLTSFFAYKSAPHTCLCMCDCMWLQRLDTALSPRKKDKLTANLWLYTCVSVRTRFEFVPSIQNQLFYCKTAPTAPIEAPAAATMDDDINPVPKPEFHLEWKQYWLGTMGKASTFD